MKINIALLEDEEKEQKKTVELLSLFAKENGFEFTIDSFSSSESIKNSDLTKYNLVLLDIILENENVNGMDIAHFIREKNSTIGIVFVTKTVQFAIQGYEVNALDYLVKPLVYEDLSLKLKKYFSSLSKSINPTLTFKCTDRILTLKENEIYYFDIYSHYIDIHSTRGVFKCRGKISDIEKMVSDSFSRISRNCIINLSYLEQIKKDDIFVNGDILKLTENFKSSFMKAFNYYLMQHGK